MAAVLDFRVATFLSVCRTLNYTRTAAELSITQPAVSQHIAWLERQTGAKLFDYRGKRLSLTEAGEILREVCERMDHDERLLQDALRALETGRERLAIGVTLTAGEYLLAHPLARWLRAHPTVDARVEQSGTEVLLRRLNDGELDCALIEGYFNKRDFAWRTFCHQELVGVCAPDSPLAHGSARTLEGLLGESLLVREAGSGTRSVLERALAERNLSVESFARRTESTSLNVIKAFAAEGLGIAFLYEAAVREELDNGVLARIPLAERPLEHDITFVRLKESAFSARFDALFEELSRLYREV